MLKSYFSVAQYPSLKGFLIWGALSIDLGASEHLQNLHVKLYLCKCICIVSRREGPELSSASERNMLSLERLRTIAFKAPAPIQFSGQKALLPGSLTETGPGDRQRNQREASCKGPGAIRELLRFHFFISKKLQLGYHPKNIFQKKKKGAGKNYHCHILNTLAGIYLVWLQEECYTFHNLIQS